MTDTLTYDEAVELLPAGDDIHTFIANGMLIGADWRREAVLDAMRASPDIQISGPMAQSARHGIAIKHPRGDYPLFVETVRRTDEEHPVVSGS